MGGARAGRGLTSARIVTELPGNFIRGIRQCAQREVSEELGLDVPGQLSVVGFDNIPESVLAAPPLTTVQQPIRRMGQEATEMLLALIAGEDVHDLDRTLDTSLVLRSSTAPPPA